MSDNGPFLSQPMVVEKDWIDYNGHMNMAYYNVLFDRGADQLFDHLGIGADYAREHKKTIYTAEIHVCYVRELHVGDVVTVSQQLIDHDAKRLHVYQELFHHDGWLSATSEVLSLHIDMAGPNVAPFNDDTLKRIQMLQTAHRALSIPEGVGRKIGIRRKAEAG